MSPRPLFFVVRPGVKKDMGTASRIEPGPIVPLIAVDQLPEWLDIVGVPRSLTVEETIGLSNLGPVLRASGHFGVVIRQDVPSRAEVPVPMPDHAGPASTVIPVTPRHNATGDEDTTHACTQKQDAPRPRADELGAGLATQAVPTGEFCRHWIRRGTCKWGLLCRYSHTMPSTAERLAAAGLTDFPAWWKRAMGLLQQSYDARNNGPQPVQQLQNIHQFQLLQQQLQQLQQQQQRYHHHHRQNQGRPRHEREATPLDRIHRAREPAGIETTAFADRDLGAVVELQGEDATARGTVHAAMRNHDRHQPVQQLQNSRLDRNLRNGPVLVKRPQHGATEKLVDI